MKRLFGKQVAAVFVTCVCSSISAPPSGAVGITDNGTVVFNSNGLESDTVGAVPANTTAGSWTMGGTGGATPIYHQVLGPASGGPGALQGVKYLREMLPYDPYFGSLTATLSTPATSGNNVVADFGLYIPAPDGINFFNNSRLGASFMKAGAVDYGSAVTWLFFAGQASDLISVIGSSATNGIAPNQLFVAAYNGSSWGNVKSGGTNMYMSVDAWHSITNSLTVGAGGSFRLTIDGLTSDPVNLNDSGNVVGLSFFSQANGTMFYLDSIPEASTVALLGLGGLLTVLRLRPKH